MVSNKMQSSLDDLVQYTQLFKPVPTVLQGTVLPFLIIYPIVFYSWIVVYGFEENVEAGFVSVAVVAAIQILVCLCCYWSVHIQCFLSCSSVSNSVFYTRPIGCRQSFSLSLALYDDGVINVLHF